MHGFEEGKLVDAPHNQHQHQPQEYLHGVEVLFDFFIELLIVDKLVLGSCEGEVEVKNQHHSEEEGEYHVNLSKRGRTLHWVNGRAWHPIRESNRTCTIAIEQFKENYFRKYNRTATKPISTPTAVRRRDHSIWP